MSSSLRTNENEKNYQRFLKQSEPKSCFICDKDLVLREFKYWILLQNKFPYDKVASKHHLLAPRRHISEFKDLKINEKKELFYLYEKLNSQYDYYQLNCPKNRTHLPHLHIHALCLL